MIEAHAEELHALGARRIGVFGSFAKNQATPESDVDVYVEFSEGMKTYDNFFALYELLRELFGRPIDLVTDGALSERKARLILPTVRYATKFSATFVILAFFVATFPPIHPTTSASPDCLSASP